MIIVLAWLVDDIEIVSTDGMDLGRSPKTRLIKVPKACVWLNKGTEKDLEKARVFAKTEGYEVFTYEKERDPLGRARRDIQGRV